MLATGTSPWGELLIIPFGTSVSLYRHHHSIGSIVTLVYHIPFISSHIRRQSSFLSSAEDPSDESLSIGVCNQSCRISIHLINRAGIYSAMSTNKRDRDASPAEFASNIEQAQLPVATKKPRKLYVARVLDLTMSSTTEKRSDLVTMIAG